MDLWNMIVAAASNARSGAVLPIRGMCPLPHGVATMSGIHRMLRFNHVPYHRV
jgi:hypothetical protein